MRDGVTTCIKRTRVWDFYSWFRTKWLHCSKTWIYGDARTRTTVVLYSFNRCNWEWKKILGAIVTWPSQRYLVVNLYASKHTCELGGFTVLAVEWLNSFIRLISSSILWRPFSDNYTDNPAFIPPLVAGRMIGKQNSSLRTILHHPKYVTIRLNDGLRGEDCWLWDDASSYYL